MGPVAEKPPGLFLLISHQVIEKDNDGRYFYPANPL
jgi:hypothetical protein